jgi:hypothetical protein
MALSLKQHFAQETAFENFDGLKEDGHVAILRRSDFPREANFDAIGWPRVAPVLPRIVYCQWSKNSAEILN